MFAFLIFFVEKEREFQKRPHGAAGETHTGKQVVRRSAQVFSDFFTSRFAVLPASFHAFSQLRIWRVPEHVKLTERDLSALSGGIPALGGSPAQFPQPFSRFLHTGPVGRSCFRLGGHLRKKPFHLTGPVFGTRLNRREELPAPYGLTCIGLICRELSDDPFRPKSWPGMALHLAVKIEHKSTQSAVISSGSHGVDQFQKTGMCVRKGIALVHRPFQRGFFHPFGAFLFQDAEIGRESRLLAVTAQQIRTKTVDRSDLRAAAQGSLPAQTGIFRIRSGGIRQTFHDASPQFTRSGAGEGDHQKAVDILWIFRIGDPGHQAFGEHHGLAAAGSRGDKDGAAAAFCCRTLGRCHLETHAFSPPSSLAHTSSLLSLG